MRPLTSPAQIPKEDSAGFTLVEVLVSLLVAVTLVSAAASALIGILRAESVSLDMLSATLKIESVMAARSLGHGETGTVAAVGQDWDVTFSELKPTKEYTNAWEVLTVMPRDRDRPRVQLFYVMDSP